MGSPGERIPLCRSSESRHGSHQGTSIVAQASCLQAGSLRYDSPVLPQENAEGTMPELTQRSAIP